MEKGVYDAWSPPRIPDTHEIRTSSIFELARSFVRTKQGDIDSYTITPVSTKESGFSKAKRLSIIKRVIPHLRKASTVREQTEQTGPPAPELPYDLLEIILRLSAQGLAQFPTSPCYVSKSWNVVATDLLYETLSPQTYRSFHLLLRTLSTVGYHGLSLRMKVRDIHLPMMSSGKDSHNDDVIYIKSLAVDEGGIPMLIPRDPTDPTTCRSILRSEYDRNSQLFKEFTRLASLCANIQNLCFPFPDSHSLASGWVNCSIVKTFDCSTLRQLTLCGVNSLQALLEGIEENQQKGTSTLPHLECLTIFDASIGSEIVKQLNRFMSNDNVQTLLPSLERLILQKIWTMHLCLPPLLGMLEAIAPQLSYVAILELGFIDWNPDVPGSIIKMGPRRIKHLVLDLSSVDILYSSGSTTDETTEERHSGLMYTINRALESLEVRLITASHRHTRSRLTVEALYQYGPPITWTETWIESLPATLQGLRFVVYRPPTFLRNLIPHEVDFGTFLQSGTNGGSFFVRNDWKDLRVTFEERRVP